ncbi:hypothetical protein [Pseudoduganella sp. R-43]|uniref:hypothetical protein n=1 Tax=Pseudoduganella sp. R-43 TaxID=3404063 RepID=UPI003CF91FFA
MSDAVSYLAPICGLVAQLRCWIRVASTSGLSTEEGDWGQLLTIPVDGYLEGPNGPYPFRDVQWIELSTNRIKSGMAGHPLQFVDIKDQILELLRNTGVTWEIRESVWSVPRIFEDQPVQVVRIVNPVSPAMAP